MVDYLQKSREIEPQLITWRRDFHRHPELAFKETRTAGIVAEHLRGLGLDVRTGVGRTGVVGTLTGSHPGPCLLLRFDMDALAMSELNDFDYASETPGLMHACGHDTHVAMGMGVAQILAGERSRLSGCIKFVFQPAEEGGFGAREMIKDGLLENPRPDMTFGIHIHSRTPSGVFAIGDGPVLAAADRFKIVIHGKGGHGAEPQDAIDPIVTAAQVVNALQTIRSRNFSPLRMGALSVCSLHSGTAFNIIPDQAELLGTFRTYDEHSRTMVMQRLRSVVEDTARAMGARAEVTIEEVIPATVNDPAISAQVRKLAAEIVGSERVILDELSSASDDVALFLNAAPGSYFVLGAARCENDYPHHNPHFEIDESAMKYGVAVLCKVVDHYLT